MQSCMCVCNHVHVGGRVHVCVCVHVYLILSGAVCNLPCVVPLDVVVYNDLILFSCCVVAMMVKVCVHARFCVCMYSTCLL